MFSRNILAAALVLAVANTANAVETPVNFAIDSNASALLVDVTVESGSANVSDGDSTSVSGSIETLIDLGNGASLPSTAGFTLTGGRINANESLQLAFNIFLLLDVNVLVENLSATMQRPMPPGSMTIVNPTTGEYTFDMAQHEFIVDQGTLAMSGRVLFNDVDSSFDFGTNPLSGAPDPGELLGSLELTPTGGNATSHFFHAELLLPIAIEDQLPLDDGGTLIANVSVTGSILARSDFAAPFGLLGDYNGNGMVDAPDYSEWRDAMTAGAMMLTNRNPENTGPVDERDFTYWRAHFGDSLGNGAGAGSVAPVPEPATLVMMLLPTAGWYLWRRPAAQRVPRSH